jgi:hypothetical protein
VRLRGYAAKLASKRNLRGYRHYGWFEPIGVIPCRAIQGNVAKARCAELAVAAKAKHLKVMLVESSRSWRSLRLRQLHETPGTLYSKLWGYPCLTHIGMEGYPKNCRHRTMT